MAFPQAMPGLPSPLGPADLPLVQEGVHMVTLRANSARASVRRAAPLCHPTLEPLEGRLLMAGLDVPQLSSRPGAAATIYLDFDGHFQASWGSFSNITSPAYDRDNNPTSFSATELSSINDIWTRVAEDFA